MPARANGRSTSSLSFDLSGEAFPISDRIGFRVPAVSLAGITDGDQGCRHVRSSRLVRTNECMKYRQMDSCLVKVPGLLSLGGSGSPERVVEVGVGVSRDIHSLPVKTGRAGIRLLPLVGLIPGVPTIWETILLPCHPDGCPVTRVLWLASRPRFRLLFVVADHNQPLTMFFGAGKGH